MKIYKLEYELFLPASASECWNFFSDPRNLQKITPPEMDFEIKSDLNSGMHAGQIIIYRIKLFAGIKISWVTEITHVSENKFFVDEQRFGPYKFWHHQHHFSPVPNGMLAKDIVHYSIPFGILGRLVNKIIIVRKLKRIFEYRAEVLKSIFK